MLQWTFYPQSFPNCEETQFASSVSFPISLLSSIYFVFLTFLYLSIFRCIFLQWNLSWYTTAMRDHLSWRTTYSCRRSYISVQLKLSPETTCLKRPYLYGHWDCLYWLYCRTCLERPAHHHKNVVSQDRESLVTGSITFKCRTFSLEYLVFQGMLSLIAVASQDRFHCRIIQLKTRKLKESKKENVNGRR